MSATLSLPGFVNAHSHAFQRALRGRVEGGDFWAWREAMLDEADGLTPARVRALYESTYRELVAAGYTAVGEFHYVGRAEALAAAEAARAAGIELVLLPVAYARGGLTRFRQESVEDYLAWVEDLRAAGIRVGVAPHSVRACPADWLERIGAYARDHTLVLHVHADEQPREIEECLAEHGCRPIELLERLGCLGPRTTVVHATHADPHELDLLAGAGASVCLCPTTEANLGDGFPPLEGLLERGIALCIGSDSNVRIDPLEELRELEGIARRQLLRRNVIPPEALLELGSAGGARSLGIETWPAIEVDLEHRSLTGIPRDEVPAALVEGCSAEVPAMPVIALGSGGASPSDVVAVAREDAVVELTAEAIAAMAEGAAVVERLAASDEPVYGVSTGFGSLATTRIPPERREELQRSLIRSHAAGMGEPVEREVVRAMMFLRARTLAMGRSGARPLVAETIASLLNAGIAPVVPEHGSLGASGDLAPLAHCALALLGEGEVDDAEGQRRQAGEVLAEAGIEPLTPSAKEGLALVNGTDGILGMLVLALHDLAELLRVLDVVAAMTVEALLGTDRAFAADLAALRPHPGQQASASNMRRLLAGSAIVASHREGDPRVQDAYSLRCTPQVHGAARDAVGFAEGVAARELVSAIDNPMVLPDGRVESCGNFHGAPLGYACDLLAIAAADAGAMSERRTDRLLDPARSHGLPPFLAESPGVDSGLMIAQYTQAALVAENRRLAVPASVDTLPTSAMQEDHVSMAWGAARKLRASVRNLRRIAAVELVAAARGLDLRAPLEPAAGTGAALASLRETVPGPGPDRHLAPELEAAEACIASGRLLEAVEAASGPFD